MRELPFSMAWHEEIESSLSEVLLYMGFPLVDKRLQILWSLTQISNYIACSKTSIATASKQAADI